MMFKSRAIDQLTLVPDKHLLSYLARFLASEVPAAEALLQERTLLAYKLLERLQNYAGRKDKSLALKEAEVRKLRTEFKLLNRQIVGAEQSASSEGLSKALAEERRVNREMRDDIRRNNKKLDHAEEVGRLTGEADRIAARVSELQTLNRELKAKAQRKSGHAGGGSDLQHKLELLQVREASLD
jgi:hypothetical protein